MFNASLMGILVLVFFGLLIISSLSLKDSRSQNILQQWADQNGVELVDAHRCFIALGTPFWAAVNLKNRTIYRITVRDASGQIRSGYALCGGRSFGLWSDRVEVKFDD